MIAEGKTNLDALDRKLIGALQENGRITNAELAALVGSSEPTVRRRVDRLLQEKVIKIVAVAEPQKLGYSVVGIFHLQTDHRHMERIEQELLAMPEVRFAGVTLGNYDVVVEAWFHSNDELREFLHNRLFKIEGVQRTESLQVLKMIKYSYDRGVRADATKSL